VIRGGTANRFADGTSKTEPPMAFGHPDHFPRGVFQDGLSNAENDRGHPAGWRFAFWIISSSPTVFSTSNGQIAQL